MMEVPIWLFCIGSFCFGYTVMDIYNTLRGRK